MKRKKPSLITNKLLLDSIRLGFGNDVFANFLEKQLINTTIPNVFGSALMGYLSDIKYESKTLYIKVNSAPLRSNLVMQRQVLINRLNAESNYKMVEEVVFR
jgi:hypothetical protein